MSIGIGDALADSASRLAQVLSESLLIGGWVAMWRPLEIFLYDWWPVREDARLFDRLSAMPVGIVYAGEHTDDAWRHDWPAVAAARSTGAAAAEPARDV